MNLKFFIPGRDKKTFIEEGVDEYKKRLSKFCNAQIIYLKEEVLKDDSSKERDRALKAEASRALKHISCDDKLILIDIHAKEIDSESFALAMKELTSKNGNISFLFGSSIGLDDSLRKRADLSLSLSKLTFTHYMALLLTIEQVYRAFKINSGQIYDK